MRAIYLAARYQRRLELFKYAEELQAKGFFVTSRWLEGEHQTKDLVASIHEQSGFAATDIGDIMVSDTVICFTEKVDKVYNRGGRHVEFGIALATNKKIIVIGPRENIFYCLPTVEQHDTWQRFKGKYKL